MTSVRPKGRSVAILTLALALPVVTAIALCTYLVVYVVTH